MNRNVESHFSELPNVEIERSMFDRSSSHKTSFNVGELIPFYVDEVLPGDTFQITTSVVARLQTLLTPIMDNMYMDTYFFYVPNRIIWSEWQQFMGENTENPWYPQTPVEVPQIEFPTNGFDTGTIADYMGVPVNMEGYVNISALPFRAYAMICDQWFRDQNVQDPLLIHTDSVTRTGVNTDSQITDIELGGKPFIVNKFHDLFTSCLPKPQKNDTPVNIFSDVLGQNPSNRFIPVKTGEDQYGGLSLTSALTPMKGHSYFESSDHYFQVGLSALSSGQDVIAINGTPAKPFTPTNLWADYSSMVLTVNQLRLAFQLQKYYEKNARGGTRYRELIKMHFGVTNPDARMMIPEYLGGNRIPISIHQIANQSQGESDFLGDLGAMSNTSDVHEDFIKSFTEHGFVIGVCCVRYDHTYAQGLEKFWTRTDKLHYYWPVFSNIGEQPIYKYELMLSDQEPTYPIFGYNEAWSEYRYKPNRVSGEMRPNIQNSLASWHLADNYEYTDPDEIPSLSAGWMREDKTNVDRVLAVTSQVSNQIFADFYVKNICTRPMPMYSIPGLIDHH